MLPLKKKKPFMPYYHIISLDVDTVQRTLFGGHIICNYLIGDRNYVLRPNGFQLYIKLKDNEVTLP